MRMLHSVLLATLNTHPSTNRARLGLTSLIETNALYHYATPFTQKDLNRKNCKNTTQKYELTVSDFTTGYQCVRLKATPWLPLCPVIRVMWHPFERRGLRRMCTIELPRQMERFAAPPECNILTPRHSKKRKLFSILPSVWKPLNCSRLLHRPSVKTAPINSYS